MGCEYSKNIAQINPTLCENDRHILALWNKFLRGECAAWQALVEAGETEGKTPPVYWMDEFQTNIFRNMRAVCPHIARKLESRPLKVRARIFCGIMKFCLVDVITHENRENAEGTRQEIARIGRAHYMWGVDDAAYITVENAMIDAMRTCLGAEFTLQIEIHLRVKYAQVKRAIQKAEHHFARCRPLEAARLRKLAAARLRELDEAEKLEASEESLTAHGQTQLVSSCSSCGSNKRRQSKNSESELFQDDSELTLQMWPSSATPV
eukprot:CAMPEP_0197464478 /NCGR_PEP_ID=MMETSP1175-20131217/64044_1 /TAXON_ID=1003142 /ORGANISM="Triceratium dubium, Strain CCMP147" /LENGTH=264 /DNA_ID=CAMNT_0043000459 /DNA_START=140 /DNA_END=934 /DNA_ORIENTATION=+